MYGDHNTITLLVRYEQEKYNGPSPWDKNELSKNSHKRNRVIGTYIDTVYVPRGTCPLLSHSQQSPPTVVQHP